MRRNYSLAVRGWRSRRRARCCDSRPRRHHRIARADYLRLLDDWQRYGEPCAFAEAFGFGADVAVVEVDDVAGDRETESEAAAFGGGVGLAEALENVREERRLDPFAFVVNADLEFVIDALEAQVDLLAGRRELDRIRQDVANDLLQTRGVGFDDVVGRTDDVRGQADAALGRVGTCIRDCGFDDG